MFAIYNQGFIQRLQRSRDRVVAAGASEKMEAFLAGFGARLYRNKTLPFPLLMKKSDFDDLSCATHNVLSAQQKIARHICEKYGKSQLISLLRLPSGLAQFINWENMFEGNTRIGRMDVVPTAQGYYFCEINTHSAVGGAEFQAYYDLFAQSLDLPGGVPNPSPIEQMSTLYAAICDQHDLARVVVLDTVAHGSLGYPRQELLRQALEQRRPGIEVCFHDERTYPASWLHRAEGAKTLIHRMFTYHDMTDDGAFYEALWKSGAWLSNSFEAEARMSKHFLAVLCDPSYHHLLSSDEQAAIRKYLPPTFMLDESRLSSALADKDALVFKIADAYGGANVLLGDEHSAAALEARVREFGVEQWICQQRLVADTLPLYFPDGPEPVDCQVVLGLYFYNESTSGMWLRASRTSNVVNLSSATGRASWAVVVTDEQKASLMSALRVGER
ncbi:MAG TPA: hypothetical protein PKI03_02425 [Pseudomonadota bacterium]|nr:hypothetical protein [Pseudomonadota bacterium]